MLEGPAITSFQDNARKSRIQSEHRELVSAMQSYIGSLENPDKPGTITMANLAPYMSKKATGGSTKLADALAKNGDDATKNTKKLARSGGRCL